MKERAPAFQFFPRQFAADEQVMGMDLDAIGAHILLMCYAAASSEGYRIRCRIDAGKDAGEDVGSDAALHSIRMRLRNPTDEAWERIKKQLLAGAWKVSPDGQWWVQDGLRRTFMKQKDFSERQAQRASSRWSRIDAGSMPDAFRNDAGRDAGSMPEICSSSASASAKSKAPASAGFNSIEVSKALCTANGWSGRTLLWALQEAVDFQSKDMPEASLEEVGQFLVDAYREHQASQGKFACGPQKFFSEGRYRSSVDSPRSKTDVFTNNPATRMQAQLEED